MDDSKLVDAPPDDLTVEDVLRISRDFDLAIIYTSTPSFANDARTAGLMKQQKPGMMIGFVGPHVTVLPEECLRERARSRLRGAQGVRLRRARYRERGPAL